MLAAAYPAASPYAWALSIFRISTSIVENVDKPAAHPGAEQRPPVARQRQPLLQPGHEVPEQERRHDVHRERRPRPRGGRMRERLGERGAGQGPERAAREDRRDRPPVRPRQHEPPPGRRRNPGAGSEPGAALARPDAEAALEAAGSGTRNDSSVTRWIGPEAISRDTAAVREAAHPHQGIIWPSLILPAAAAGQGQRPGAQLGFGRCLWPCAERSPGIAGSGGQHLRYIVTEGQRGGGPDARHREAAVR